MMKRNLSRLLTLLKYLTDPETARRLARALDVVI